VWRQKHLLCSTCFNTRARKSKTWGERYRRSCMPDKNAPALDVGLIAATQAVENYEIARYETLWPGPKSLAWPMQLRSTRQRLMNKPRPMRRYVAWRRRRERAGDGASSIGRRYEAPGIIFPRRRHSADHPRKVGRPSLSVCTRAKSSPFRSAMQASCYPKAHLQVPASPASAGLFCARPE
jgi:hypothetical protein